MGLKHTGPEQEYGARRRKRGHLDWNWEPSGGARKPRATAGGKGGGGSVCNSLWRWCEAMRCDRSAMSCGRPDGPAAVPAARRSIPAMSIPDPVTAYAYSRVTTTNIRRGRSKR